MTKQKLSYLDVVYTYNTIRKKISLATHSFFFYSKRSKRFSSFIKVELTKCPSLIHSFVRSYFSFYEHFYGSLKRFSFVVVNHWNFFDIFRCSKGFLNKTHNAQITLTLFRISFFLEFLYKYSWVVVESSNTENIYRS